MTDLDTLERQLGLAADDMETTINVGVLRGLIARQQRLAGHLAIFLGHDDRFQVAVGGNPIAIERMLSQANAALRGDDATESKG